MEIERVALSTVVAPSFSGVWRDLFADRHDEYWLAGGRGSGKSTFAAAALIVGLLKRPDASALVFRKVQATLRESVYAQLLWTIEKLGLGGCFEERLSPMELIYRPTGQRVLFRGADDPAKSKGLKLRKGYFAYLWFEELSEFAGMDDLRTVQASVLRGGGHAATICTFNPPISPRAWVNRQMLEPNALRLTHRGTYRDLPPEWLGEPFLRQAAALQAQNPDAYRHMYLGECVGGAGQVFRNLALRPVRAGECAQTLRFGLDFGFAGDPDALVCCALDQREGRLWVLRERVRRGQTIERLAEAVRGMTADCLEPPIVTCDGADPRMIAELRARGVLAVAAKKGADSVMHGVRCLQSLREIVVDPTACPIAAAEFSACEYRRDGEGYLPQVEDRDNHTIDAVRYALESVLTRRSARLI